MIIHRMTAVFGCLNHATLELKEGLNILEAPNEGGKSTWCAFLITMLYGFPPRERDKKDTPADKNRYRPWNGAPMEGLLECSLDGKGITLRRTSDQGAPMGSFSAVFSDTGEAVPGMTEENAGLLLTGVGREVFERSLFIRQESLAVGQSGELEQRIATIVSSGDEQVSWSQAEGKLREWQRQRRHYKNSQLLDLEQEEAELQGRLRQLQGIWEEHLHLEEEISEEQSRLRELTSRDRRATSEHMQEMELRWAEAAAELDAAQLQLQSLEAQDEENAEEEMWDLEDDIQSIRKDVKRRGRRLLFISFLALILSGLMVAPTFFPDLDLAVLSFPTLSLAIAVMGIAILLANFARVSANRRDAAEIMELQAELNQRQTSEGRQDLAWDAALAREQAARTLFDVLSTQLEGVSLHSQEALDLEHSISQKRQRLALLTGRLQELGDPSSVEAELETNRSVQKRLEREHEALGIAISALNDAERELRARFSPKLNDRTAYYFTRLTTGAYEKVTLDREFRAQIEKAGSLSLRPASYLSQGTSDQLYLALRLALCELVLPQHVAAPLILDDILLTFDDRRAAKALELFLDLAEDRQILLFTCHGRETQLLSGKSTFYGQNIARNP